MPYRSEYLAGWSQGVRSVSKYAQFPRLCMSTARFLIKAQAAGPYGNGWADAILSGFGA